MKDIFPLPFDTAVLSLVPIYGFAFAAPWVTALPCVLCSICFFAILAFFEMEVLVRFPDESSKTAGLARIAMAFLLAAMPVTVAIALSCVARAL
jgi:hypothetical protein